jgi:hypothetical protein
MASFHFILLHQTRQQLFKGSELRLVRGWIGIGLFVTEIINYSAGYRILVVLLLCNERQTVLIVLLLLMALVIVGHIRHFLLQSGSMLNNVESISHQLFLQIDHLITGGWVRSFNLCLRSLIVNIWKFLGRVLFLLTCRTYMGAQPYELIWDFSSLVLNDVFDFDLIDHYHATLGALHVWVHEGRSSLLTYFQTLLFFLLGKYVFLFFAVG